MLIDWFTVGAQVLNFLVLVWLLKRFLYQPILKAIDAREKRIATKIANADQMKAEAQKEGDDFKRKNEAFDQERADLLSQASQAAQAEGHRLLDLAREAAEVLSARREETARKDAHALNQALGLRARQEVFAIARKALADLAGVSLEERLGEVFIRRLRELDPQTRDSLAKEMKKSSVPVLVRSVFELPAEQRGMMQHALNETFSADVPVRFETEPDLISGFELTTHGQKLAWNMADYILSLEKGVEEVLQKQDEAEQKPKEPRAKTERP
jgi:F-type H+-transporting ATPase subunit b